jgi:DNA repair exonuclease SbcCD ATPase subunit
MSTRPTPETDAAIIAANGTWTFELKEAMQKLERERDEAREKLQQWKMLCAWGGTPFHIDQFIKGQQMRIYEAQDIEETCEQLERDLNEAREQLEAMREAIKKGHDALTGCVEDSGELLAEHDWWKDEPRCGYQLRYEETKQRIEDALAALAKLKPFIL